MPTPAPQHFDLGLLPVVTLTGPDARRFSNGMFTQNVRDLAVGAGARSAMTDDRGRVLGLMDLYCTADETFLLVLEGVDGEWFQERYGMYIVFDDVTLADLTGQLQVLSVQGDGADAVVAAALGVALPDGDHRIHGTVQVLRCDRTGTSGWDLLVPPIEVAALQERLAEAGATVASTEDLRAARVVKGLPTWPDDASGERTFVHELGLRDSLLSFDKGCYVGQEVINRMDTMGKATRKLRGLALAGDGLPAPGATVAIGGKASGRVGSAAAVGGRHLALAVVQRAGWEPGTAVEVTQDDRSWSGTIEALPFA